MKSDDWGVGKSARQVALMEQLEQAKKELGGALTLQVVILQHAADW